MPLDFVMIHWIHWIQRKSFKENSIIYERWCEILNIVMEIDDLAV